MATKVTKSVKSAAPAKKAAVKAVKIEKTAAPAKKEAKAAPKKDVVAKTVAVSTKPEVKAKGAVTVSLVTTTGAADGTMTVPEGILNAEVNKRLIAIAMRVYLANQREGGAHTKTRGEVEGSTRKIYKQKGTGKARHGSIRAPIFVGGGIVFGPRHHRALLTMTETMKRQAFVSALTHAYAEGHMSVVSSWKGVTGKTKTGVEMIQNLCPNGKTLIITTPGDDTVTKSVRNIKGVVVIPANTVTTYNIATHTSIIVSKAAIEDFVNRMSK
jgi:large subunit ribosomal protein L4